MPSHKQKFKVEHERYLRERGSGKCDLEIKREFGWTSQQLRRHQAQAFEDHVSFTHDPNELVLEMSELPANLLRFLEATDDTGLVKFKRDAEKGRQVMLEIF